MELLFNIGFLEFGFIDAVDILFVSILLYQLYKLLKGSVAVNIFLGFLTIYLFYLLVSAMGMTLLSDILGQFIGVGVIAAIILFQQELRRFLLLIGQTTFVNNETLSRLFQTNRQQHEVINFDDVIAAVEDLAKTRMGALIVFANDSELREYTDTGDILDAKVSKRLLISIFNKESPMHDGAVIIGKGRLIAARCVVPVTSRQDIPAQFGLRHRAGIGISEVSDGVVVIVSEETGHISLAHTGTIHRNLNKTTLKRQLKTLVNNGQKSKRKVNPKRFSITKNKTEEESSLEN